MPKSYKEKLQENLNKSKMLGTVFFFFFLILTPIIKLSLTNAGEKSCCALSVGFELRGCPSPVIEFRDNRVGDLDSITNQTPLLQWKWFT